MGNSMKISGAFELEKALRLLPDRVARRQTFQALTAGAKVIQKAARANLVASPSVDTGALVNAVKTTVRKKSRKGTAVTAVGVENKAYTAKRKGSSKPMKINPKNYAHLVEFGTEKMAAEPFMRPAMDSQGGAALTTILERLAKGIEKEAAKLASGKTSFRTGRRIG